MASACSALVEEADTVFDLAEFILESAGFPCEYSTELTFPAGKPVFNRTDLFRITYLSTASHPMITSEKLAVYRKFQGDDDGWSRAGSPKREIFDDADWVAIRNLLQELTMLKRDLVSREYGERIRRRLSEMTADQDVARTLLEMADALAYQSGGANGRHAFRSDR